MQVAFGMLMFFGGPLAILLGLVRPTLYRGGRLRALGVGVIISVVGLVGALLFTTPQEWRAMAERSDQARAERTARDTQEAADRAAAREAAAEERERTMREQEAGEAGRRAEAEERERTMREQEAGEPRRRAEAEQRRADDARAAEVRATEERARAEAAAANSARPRPTVVNDPRGQSIFVWRSSAAHDEAMRLINAGVHRSQPQLIMPLLSCIVPNDTKIVTLPGGGWATNQIMVVDGPETGCRGIVPIENIQRR